MRIAIVDGHSTGRALVAALRSRGVSCVHVHSSSDMPAYFLRGFDPDDYEADLGTADDPNRLAAQLAEWGVDRVVAGTESGVLLSDQLSDLLELPGHRPETSAARRDKSLMMRAVADAGLAIPFGERFSEAQEAVRWFEEVGLAEAVVKPLSSAGTDNVRFCRTAADVGEAVDRVLTADNLYGQRNGHALVQERLRGTEYYVNSVSHDGVHKIAEIWRYTKRVGASGSPVYDYEEPVAASSVEAKLLVGFVQPVLDALGVVSGAAHTEVMATARGPVLIESGARLGGATLPHIVEKYCGASQTSLLADTLTDPSRLARFDDTALGRSGALRNVALINHEAGEVRSLDWAARIAALPTCVALVHGVERGVWLGATTDLIDSPGYLYLASEDVGHVERDYAHLRQLESEGFYTH
jgi:biotin carboxylase